MWGAVVAALRCANRDKSKFEQVSLCRFVSISGRHFKGDIPNKSALPKSVQATAACAASDAKARAASRLHTQKRSRLLLYLLSTALPG